MSVSAIELRAPRDPSEQAVAAMIDVPDVAVELGLRFAGAGFQLALVGGSVRDALLGRPVTPDGDLDFATDARPEQIREIVRGWAQGTWDAGIAFGTVGVLRGGVRLEITTYRTEQYDRGSRKPQVRFGDTLEGDLVRRDFTVNALAVSLPGLVFLDYFGGLRDLAAGRLRTPGPATESFDDDPLRMMRAARFASQLGFQPDDAVLAAMRARADRITIVSPERVRDELSKLLCGEDPRAGLELLVDTGVVEYVLPELPRLRMTIDPVHQHKDVYEHTLAVLERAIRLEPGPGCDLGLRLAALLHDVGKPDTRAFEAGGGVSFHHHEVVGARLARKRLLALHYPKELVEDVEQLVLLHLRFHGYGTTAAWTDSAVRRYVTDAGRVLDRLHLLVRADCTTRNRRKAAALDAAYDDLERRIADLRAREDLERVRPDLDGNEIGAILGIPPGPDLGRAWRYLKELRLEHGPLPREEAEAELRRWAAENL